MATEAAVWPKAGPSRGARGPACLNPTADPFVPRGLPHALASASPPPPSPPADAWPQPLSALEAGVALCLLVVREPDHGVGAHAARWPVGRTPAQRLLLRARVSRHGIRLPPHHVNICARSFPPPWRKAGEDWLRYARHVCALDELSFWHASQLLAEDRSLSSATSIEGARTAGWSQVFAKDLRRRYDASFRAPPVRFCYPAPSRDDLDEEEWPLIGEERGRRSPAFVQFTGQAYHFGAEGPRALRLLDVAPLGSALTTVSKDRFARSQSLSSLEIVPSGSC